MNITIYLKTSNSIQLHVINKSSMCIITHNISICRQNKKSEPLKRMLKMAYTIRKRAKINCKLNLRFELLLLIHIHILLNTLN